MTLAPHKHQMFEHSRAGQTRGDCCAQAPVAPYELRDWMASRHAGFLRDDLPNLLKTCPGLRGSGLSHSHWSRLSSRTATNCGVSCTMHALPRIHSSRHRACKPFARHALPVKQLSQSLAYRNHHQPSFRNPSSFDVQELSGRRLPNGQKRTASRSKND